MSSLGRESMNYKIRTPLIVAGSVLMVIGLIVSQSSDSAPPREQYEWESRSQDLYTTATSTTEDMCQSISASITAWNILGQRVPWAQENNTLLYYARDITCDADAPPLEHGEQGFDIAVNWMAQVEAWNADIRDSSGQDPSAFPRSFIAEHERSFAFAASALAKACGD